MSKEQFSLLSNNNKKKLISIQSELFIADCSIYYVSDEPEYFGIRGEILSFTLERCLDYYRLFYNKSVMYDKRLTHKFIQKLMQGFINSYYRTDGFSFVFESIEESYTSRLYCRINNQFTLNMFVKYMKDNESYIRINTL